MTNRGNSVIPLTTDQEELFAIRLHNAEGKNEDLSVLCLLLESKVDRLERKLEFLTNWTQSIYSAHSKSIDAIQKIEVSNLSHRIRILDLETEFKNLSIN